MSARYPAERRGDAHTDDGEFFGKHELNLQGGILRLTIFQRSVGRNKLKNAENLKLAINSGTG